MTKKARIPGGTFFDDSCEDLPLWINENELEV